MYFSFFWETWYKAERTMVELSMTERDHGMWKDKKTASLKGEAVCALLMKNTGAYWLRFIFPRLPPLFVRRSIRA